MYQNENDDGNYFRCQCLSLGTVFNLHHSIQFYRFQNVLVWTAENASKWQCGRELIHAFSIKIKTHTFENTLVWMGPRSVADLWEGHEGDLNLHLIFRSN